LTGWTFESGNTQQLTSVIRKAMTSSSAVLQRMGAAAHAESTRWSIRAAAEGIARSVTTALQ